MELGFHLLQFDMTSDGISCFVDVLVCEVCVL